MLTPHTVENLRRTLMPPKLNSPWSPQGVGPRPPVDTKIMGAQVLYIKCRTMHTVSSLHPWNPNHKLKTEQVFSF